MKILVAYASRHGSTRGIAERLAERLAADGLVAEARSVGEVRDIAPYDAVVLGSAAYLFHWLKEATTFAHRNRAGLARKPVWLFSSGPVGTDLVDEKGRDVFETTVPKEWADLRTQLKSRGERIFFGAWDPAAPAIGASERFLRILPASRSMMPSGDFRDWPAIEAWADEIADDLRAIPLA